MPQAVRVTLETRLESGAVDVVRWEGHGCALIVLQENDFSTFSGRLLSEKAVRDACTDFVANFVFHYGTDVFEEALARVEGKLVALQRSEVARRFEP